MQPVASRACAGYPLICVVTRIGDGAFLVKSLGRIVFCSTAGIIFAALMPQIHIAVRLKDGSLTSSDIWVSSTQTCSRMSTQPSGPEQGRKPVPHLGHGGIVIQSSHSSCKISGTPHLGSFVWAQLTTSLCGSPWYQLQLVTRKYPRFDGSRRVISLLLLPGQTSFVQCVCPMVLLSKVIAPMKSSGLHDQRARAARSSSSAKFQLTQKLWARDPLAKDQGKGFQSRNASVYVLQDGANGNLKLPEEQHRSWPWKFDIRVLVCTGRGIDRNFSECAMRNDASRAERPGLAVAEGVRPGFAVIRAFPLRGGRAPKVFASAVTAPTCTLPVPMVGAVTRHAQGSSTQKATQRLLGRSQKNEELRLIAALPLTKHKTRMRAKAQISEHEPAQTHRSEVAQGPQQWIMSGRCPKYHLEDGSGPPLRELVVEGTTHPRQRMDREWRRCRKQKSDQKHIRKALAEVKWTYEVVSGLPDRLILEFMVQFLLATRQLEWTVKTLYKATFDYCFPRDFKARLRSHLERAKQGQSCVRDFVCEIHQLTVRFPDVTDFQLVQILWRGLNMHLHAEPPLYTTSELALGVEWGMADYGRIAEGALHHPYLCPGHTWRDHYGTASVSHLLRKRLGGDGGGGTCYSGAQYVPGFEVVAAAPVPPVPDVPLSPCPSQYLALVCMFFLSGLQGFGLLLFNYWLVDSGHRLLPGPHIPANVLLNWHIVSGCEEHYPNVTRVIKPSWRKNTKKERLLKKCEETWRVGLSLAGGGLQG
ncbi:hypothetical protein C8Q73DRAFT_666644 [Cubamyces lactineus]|nr:hypothetical protein C8Q73DRAFT_666644 [Cubamyces lactineus]